MAGAERTERGDVAARSAVMRVTGELGARLRGLADRGQSMLLIEHDMGLVLGIERQRDR